MRASFTIVILTTATCLHAITPPVAFEKNEGQTPREVAFLARVGGSRLFLVREGAEIAGIHLHLLGATPVDPVGRQLLAAKSNYLTGTDRSHWRTGIANYQEVWYPRVYRGIDARWHAQAGEIEQDFELAPGADPRQRSVSPSAEPHPRLRQAAAWRPATSACTRRALTRMGARSLAGSCCAGERLGLSLAPTITVAR
jgi:hypothetical protein